MLNLVETCSECSVLLQLVHFDTVVWQSAFALILLPSGLCNLTGYFGRRLSYTGVPVSYQSGDVYQCNFFLLCLSLGLYFQREQMPGEMAGKQRVVSRRVLEHTAFLTSIIR